MPIRAPDRDSDFSVEAQPSTPWLVIPYDIADAGARPIPNGNVFWVSPSIWLSDTDTDPLGNAVAGRPTGVHARIWNLGAFEAAPTRVDFSYADPALGIPWHAPKSIGTASVPTIPPRSTIAVDCPDPWVPEVEGTSHPCLLVTCSSDLFDPATAPGNPRLDRHTAQRNVTVVRASAGRTVEIRLAVAPTLRHLELQQVTASAAFLDPDRRAELPIGDSLTATLEHLELTASGPQQRLQIGRAVALARDQAAGHDARLAPHELADLLGIQSGRALVAGAELPLSFPQFPDMLGLGEARRPRDLAPELLRLELNVPERGGDLVVHLRQFEGALVTGGYSIFVRT